MAGNKLGVIELIIVTNKEHIYYHCSQMFSVLIIMDVSCVADVWLTIM